MKLNLIKTTAALIFTVLFAFASSVEAQGIFDKMKDKVDKTKKDATKTDSSKTASTEKAAATNNNGSNSQNNTEPTLPATTILKPTLRVVTLRDQNYWKQPNAKNFWSWIPRVMFEITGPLSAGSVFTAEFSTPDGKTWFSAESSPLGADIPAGQTTEIEIGRLSNNSPDNRSSIATGSHNFKIILKNTNQEVYRGNYKVNKFFAGTNHPDFKNQNVFYVEQDWSLPIGYLWFDAKQYPNAPVLNVSMWLRGENDSDLHAYLFYNGKQISATDSSATGAVNRIVSNLSEGDSDQKAVWGHKRFTFFNVKEFNKGENAGETHQIGKNSGNYEIKVLLKGELVRTASFTVGDDGKIKDNGVAAGNGFSGYRTVLPVKVIPTAAEGKIDLQSWKTDAFYGNPLSGFSVQ